MKAEPIQDDQPILGHHWQAIRSDGLTFLECVIASFESIELIAQFDRLWGTNILLRGAPIDSQIDLATGRHKEDMQQFIRFVWNYIFIRIPPVMNPDPSSPIRG